MHPFLCILCWWMLEHTFTEVELMVAGAGSAADAEAAQVDSSSGSEEMPSDLIDAGEQPRKAPRTSRVERRRGTGGKQGLTADDDGGANFPTSITYSDAVDIFSIACSVTSVSGHLSRFDSLGTGPRVSVFHDKDFKGIGHLERPLERHLQGAGPRVAYFRKNPRLEFRTFIPEIVDLHGWTEEGEPLSKQMRSPAEWCPLDSRFDQDDAEEYARTVERVLTKYGQLPKKFTARQLRDLRSLMQMEMRMLYDKPQAEMHTVALQPLPARSRPPAALRIVGCHDKEQELQSPEQFAQEPGIRVAKLLTFGTSQY